MRAEAVLLTTRADVASAAPGPLYAASSDSAAYYPAAALLESGSAQLLGEAWDERGKVVVLRLLRPGGAAAAEVARADPAARRTITIGAEFFVTALKDYRDWPIKWWREAVQNAVDAGARHVILGSRTSPDGTVTVYCDDDGGGMDEATILDKFLVLGGTTKLAAGGAAGGFGKAKELLLLPWIGWRVQSLSTTVEGAGIDYQVATTSPRRGTRLEVVMPADRCTGAAQALAFVQRCYLPDVEFTVESDGKPSRVRAALAPGERLQSLPGKVDLYYVPSKDKQPDLYVRTKGLYMFSRYVGDVPGFLLAELTGPSVDLLTANRDGFRDWSTQAEVDRFAERIAKDTRSALRGGNLIRQKFAGTGKFKARSRASELLMRVGPTRTGRGGKVELDTSTTDALVQAVNDYARGAEQREVGALPDDREMVRALLDQKFRGPDHLEAAIKQLVWEPDFFVVNEDEGYKVDKKFFPATMTPHVLKLAKSWVELVRFVMMQLGSDEKFGVGWIFSGETAAAALRDEDKEGSPEQWVLLNPFRDLGKRGEIWHPTQGPDLKWLYAAAIHECTHVADGISYHDESFAAALTRNVARCADGYRKIRQIVEGIRMRGGPEAD